MTARVRLAVVAVTVALLGGCAATGHPGPVRSATPVTSGFSSMGLTFRYPAAWQSATASSDVSSFSAVIVFLSTSPLSNPCTTVTISPGHVSKSCGFPLSKLPARGILVRWSAEGFPGSRTPKANITVGGRPAAETTTTGGWCATLGGTETITVTIPRTAGGNWYEMDACLSGPGRSQHEANISSMLNSVRISKGA
jgi:hypothetical protein